uniref:Uncharacterized protein n=1 Tax=Arundo donax TaxID=35708 RepID=A0A0A9E1M7_ARUDO
MTRAPPRAAAASAAAAVTVARRGRRSVAPLGIAVAVAPPFWHTARRRATPSLALAVPAAQRAGAPRHPALSRSAAAAASRA